MPRRYAAAPMLTMLPLLKAAGTLQLLLTPHAAMLRHDVVYAAMPLRERCHARAMAAAAIIIYDAITHAFMMKRLMIWRALREARRAAR